MEQTITREAKSDRDEMLARAATLATQTNRDACKAYDVKVRAYRSMVAEVNALTDSDMELALLAG